MFSTLQLSAFNPCGKKPITPFATVPRSTTGSPTVKIPFLERSNIRWHLRQKYMEDDLRLLLGP